MKKKRNKKKNEKDEIERGICALRETEMMMFC